MTKPHLASPPWTDSELRVAYFADFQATYAALEQLPGASQHQLIAAIRMSVELFNDSVDVFLEATRAFKTSATDPLFWLRANRHAFDVAERHIRCALFTAASAAMALVDHVRADKEKMPAELGELRRAMFDEQEHAFIQDLRNVVNHRRVAAPQWHNRFRRIA